MFQGFHGTSFPIKSVRQELLLVFKTIVEVLVNALWEEKSWTNAKNETLPLFPDILCAQLADLILYAKHAYKPTTLPT